MKIVNTVVVSALLAIGLAGNAAAAPSEHHSKRGAIKLYKVQKVSNHAAKKITIKKAVKQAVKRSVHKAVVKRVAKKSYSKVYRVRPGDTLYRIAARNHTSVGKLVKLNQLWGKKASNLRVGMVIRLS